METARNPFPRNLTRFAGRFTMKRTLRKGRPTGFSASIDRIRLANLVRCRERLVGSTEYLNGPQISQIRADEGK